MDINLLASFLKRANSAGHHGQRLVRVVELPMTASSDPMNQYALIYDDGPKNVTDSDW